MAVTTKIHPPECWAIVLAAGSATRFGGSHSKCFHLLDGRPVLYWSLSAFDQCDAISRIIVVSLDDDAAYVAPCVEALSSPHNVVSGGSTRENSLNASLNWISAQPHVPDIVLVHDAARPLVTHNLIMRLLKAYQSTTTDAVIPVLSEVDSLSEVRKVGDKIFLGTAHLNKNLARIQTPQLYRLSSLTGNTVKDHPNESDPAHTVPEWERLRQNGSRVLCIPGDNRLRKITFASDIAHLVPHAVAMSNQPETASGAIRQSKPDIEAGHKISDNGRLCRVSMGYDVHRVVSDRPLWLAGVRISDRNGLDGHSDADIVLHALCDALYGLTGSGDIGDTFQPGDPRWKDASSAIFVTHALASLHSARGMLTNVDCTLVVEQPRIAPHRDAMCRRLAELVSLPIHRISIKATTHEGLGCFGRGEGMAAWVLVHAMLPFR